MSLFQEINFPKTVSYSSDSEYIPLEFYEEAFPRSTTVDMVLGYFSTNAIRTLCSSFAEFIFNGGKMRIVTNHILSQEDKENLLIDTSIKAEDMVIDIFQDLEKLKKELGPYGKYFFDCLKYLLAEQRLEIQPVMHKPNAMAHYKKVIFFDGQEHLYINGSANFTYSGLVKNGESFNVDRSWSSQTERMRISAEIQNFNLIFSRKHESFEYLDADKVKGIINTVGDELNLEELLEKVKNILEDDKISDKIKSIHIKKQKEFAIKIEKIKVEPRFPHRKGPREYQMDAYKNWVNNQKRGIFAMATGTGKTLTSLNCLLETYKETKIYRAVILVPTIALTQQWKKECQNFNYKNIITVSSKENWTNNLSFFNTASQFIDASFIIIATYSSFQKKKFQSYFRSMPNDTLLIADEVHNMGTNSMLSLLPNIHLRMRIGLSATPSRKYDMIGNEGIESFFNDQSPYVFSYSMRMALKNKWLCNYTYYPHIAYLTEKELEAYANYSKELLKYFDFTEKKYHDCKQVEILLLKRKRIIHKAVNKKEIFRNILNSEFSKRGNLDFTLVYVPEGIDVDYNKEDNNEEGLEDLILIDEYTRMVNQTDSSIMVKQFTAKTQNREKVIEEFGVGKINVLTSMKCLDEGVDVPRSELAIFCASTGNPRQFIQRRGRVLRLHNDKVHAVIHDLVVVPMTGHDMSTFEMERNILTKEIERVVDFSELSMNKIDTYNSLKAVIDYYNINLNDFTNN